MDPEPFLTHRRLDGPEPGAIEDAFASLPRRASLDVLCCWERRAEALAALARSGAFALCVRPHPGFDPILITALKGKAGACFETGRTATYLGAAAAAMDDDRHLIAGSIRVCEKTGGLYALPPYHGLLSVTGADPILLRRLDTDPVPFDCSTFEADAERIAAGPFPAVGAEEPRVAAFYPGPFSRLILRDGSLVVRGACAAIPERLASELQARDGMLLLPRDRAPEAEPPPSYPSLFRSLGAGCLLDELAGAAHSDRAPEEIPAAKVEVPPSAWHALREAPPDLRRRIGRLLDRAEPYFILTGSDPRDPGGCCPSPLVEAANRLAEAGVLARFRTPAPPDACSTTLYAFAGEIAPGSGRPRFAFRSDIRRRASAVLAP